MSGSIVHPQRQTSADIIFERLYDQIISLALLPGTKISEADVAERFGVSRQPVRDEAFHKLITDIAAKPFAFDIVKEQKAKIDRICVLSLKDAHGMQELVNDHQQLVECLSKNDKVGAERCLRIHLSRISKTIEIVQARHEYVFPSHAI